MAGAIWEVVGGKDKGGILVREGQDNTSPEKSRISTGAFVHELELKGDRLHFKKASGTGPEEGWASIKLKDKELMWRVPNVWEVVGGRDKGGIVARQGQDVSSPECTVRLSTGALVKQLDIQGTRLQYKLIAGTGPGTGWVSIKFKDKDILTKKEAPKTQPKSAAQPSAGPGPAAQGDRLNRVPDHDGEWNPYVVLQIAPSATDFMLKRAFRQMSLKTHPDQNPDDPEAATKFREVQKAKEFLLNPHKRRAFNMKKGYLIDLAANPIYWSSWQTMFDELGDLELEDIKTPEQIASEQSGNIDILILGCSALTGMLGIEWMSKQPAGSPSWAIAGRTAEKVEVVANKFGRGPNYRGKFVVTEPKELDSILPNVKILVNYQGPPRISRTAEVVALALKHGCHYIDITGDVPLHRDLIKEHNDEAKMKGLVYMLHQGFTALPPDIITYCAVKFLREKHQTECKRAVVYSWTSGGGMSGTTFAAGLEADHADIEVGNDPFALGGIRKAGLRDEDKDFKECQMDGFSSQWIAPDSMARGDTRIVRRSCALFEEEDAMLSYGRNFSFKMCLLAPDKMSAQMSAFVVKQPLSMRDKLVDQKKVPPVGFGPAERLRKEALAIKICNVEGENSKEAHCVMRSGPGGFGDGYQSSGMFSVVIATLLCTEIDKMPKERRGFVTAAYLLGDVAKFYEILADNFLTWECYDGRAPQDLFRSVLGGVMAITTDRGMLEGPAPPAEPAGMLPWANEAAPLPWNGVQVP